MIKRWNKILLLVLIIFSVLLPSQTLLAASKLSLYNYSTKKSINYTGQQVKYTIDGKTINSKYPGIIQDGTALGSYYDVFATSSLKVSSKYDKTKGTVTLKKNNNTVVLTIGSKKATVNGKSVTMSVAPVKMQYKSLKTTRILVPTRFVAENLGYTYVWTSSTSTAAITSPLTLKYDGKIVYYNGTRGKVTVDGKNIGLGDMPGIVINSTAMVRAKQVFANSSIKAGYEYNSKTKQLTLTKGKNTVVFTLGSKTALVNGKEKTLSQAPQTITNVDKNVSLIMVPASFTSSALGYDYVWNSTTKTSMITTRKVVEDTKDTSDGPELGDDAVVDHVDTTWNATEEYTSVLNELSNLPVTELSGQGVDVGLIDSVERDYSVTDKEVYTIKLSQPLNKANVEFKDNKLTINLSNMISNASSYVSDGTLVTAINSEYDSSTTITKLIMDVYSNDALYDVKVSEDQLSVVVTVYNNYLTKMVAEMKSGKNRITLTTLRPMDMVVSDEGDTLFIELDNIINTLGDKSKELKSLDSIVGIQIVTISNNKIYISIDKQVMSTYKVEKKDNTQSIIFELKKEVVEDIEDETDEIENSDGISSNQVLIPLPDGYTYDFIGEEDRYYNKQIVFKVPGDYVDYFDFMIDYNTSGVVKKVAATYKNDYTEVVITTSKLQGYRVTDQGDSLLVTLGNPRDIYDRIVVLDAGHGGDDPGAIRSLNGKSIYEKNLNQAVISRTEKYFNASDSTIKVYYTIINDKFISLYDRAAFAKQVGADLFISMHMNAFTTSTPSGTEIYYNGSTNKNKLNGLDSKKFASIVLSKLPGKIGTSTRYIHDKNYVVIRDNTVPAILIELGFMSNPSDLKLLTSATVQEKAAKALYDILESIFEQYPTNR